ncbi:ABC transporter substrate-binding protein [Aliiroseovarius sp. Z3]|uniref:ABC transporter substrate-binding protein n=1 Tax=Aliiroseovarius sp. Z3 TaxID=2811402 RepID=UPI0023B302E3|nr:ABC transporter substrate-binding protein [Aliiroseovarius sp. Z3]MDE9450044.1 ABC transporter substrate-binding protein [Aliiroseovarius sp. Z3]
MKTILQRMTAVLSVALTTALSPAFAGPDVLRASVLEFGTVNWELDTIKSNGLDTANGFTLEVTGVAGGAAAKVAFEAGETDVIVSDWLWVARQRAAGRDFVFLPYSKAVGGLMVPADSTAQTLADLKGGKIGIAGGPLDKSWLILRAYADQQYELDLVEETEQVFGAPPLIFKTATSGDYDGAINFWHFMAKMEAGGMRQLVSVSEAAEALGLDPNTPLLGYVLRGDMARENPDLVAGLSAASRAAKELLMQDAAWEPLRERMRAKTDAQFKALIAGFRAGIPDPGPVDEGAADKILRLMAKLGGTDLLGDVESLPAGVFLTPGS